MGRQEIVEGFRFQCEAAATVGSRMYAELLSRATEDVESGGPVARLVEGWEGHPILDNLPLRLMGAVHALVLAGEATELAAYYPSVGGVFHAPAAWKAFLDVIESRGSELHPALSAQVQTNEVRRCAALLGGFLQVAEATCLPLRLLEVGSSAGLNLFWDRYRYALGEHRWGPSRSPLLLQTEWEGAPPPLAVPVRVVSRAGCDVSPIDITKPTQRIRLESFVWPDQPERLARLRSAVELALGDPPDLVARSAADWLPIALGEKTPERTTVLFQSVVWWYLSAAEREKVTEIVERAGEEASREAPLAWLRFEGATAKEVELRLRLWPGEGDRLLGRAHYHGDRVRWLG